MMIQGIEDKNFHHFPTSPWTAIGCTEINQPIEVTVHSQCMQRYVGERWVTVTMKNTIFPEYPVHFKKFISSY